MKLDMEQMEEIVEDMNKINAALNESHSIMQDFVILANRSKAANIITSDIIKVIFKKFVKKILENMKISSTRFE